jgi:hypothetical protein
MPVPLELFLKKSWHQRQRLLRGWINLPSADTTALRNWMNGKPRPEPASSPVPLQQPAQAPNPPVPMNNGPTTTPTRRITIDKILPRSTPNTDQHRITSFFPRNPQARAPQRPAVPPPLSPSPAIPRNQSTSLPRKCKAPSTTLLTAEPRKRKETNQETQMRRRRRVALEYAHATNHGGIINLQIMTQKPPTLPRRRPSCQPKGQVRTKLAVGEQVPPKVPTQRVDVDVSQ